MTRDGWILFAGLDQGVKASAAVFADLEQPRLRAALDQLPAIFDELPLEWLHVDEDEGLPVQLDEERVTSALKLPFTDPDTFWKLP